MTVLEYLDEKLGMIILNLLACVGLSAYLFTLGTAVNALILIWIVWALILLTAGSLSYMRLCAKYSRLRKQLDGLDKKYLITELLDKPENMAERIYYQMLRSATQAMLEDVSRAQSDYRSYKEYIEEWIHEIKSPILAVELLCKNHPSPEGKKILRELSSIRHLVEQALYYVRSGYVENDYFIREFPIYDAVGHALAEYRTLLLEENIRIITDDREDTVYTDEKWLSFIIGQLISNAVKYHASQNPCLQFSLTPSPQGVFLTVEDNGKGILPEDLPRIFEKGFTGKDRKNRESTGMGLYLCRKLCEKLGLSIRAESKAGEYTRIIIGFPKGRMHLPGNRQTP